MSGLTAEAILFKTFEKLGLPVPDLPDLWTPFAGPQEQAIENQANELFFGGAAGGGKSYCLLGIALSNHRRAIIFRREHTQLRELEDKSAMMLVNTKARYNHKDHIWNDLPGGRFLEFGGVPYEQNVNRFQGRAHDFKGFDELPTFTKKQYVLLKTWCRTDVIGQRTRIFSTGNPPLDDSGMWVVEYWAPWLDPAHKHPAQSGEIRWFIEMEGRDIELEDNRPVRIGNRSYKPRSRSFIRATVEDNPVYMATNYDATLDSLPEPLRSKLRYGIFHVKAEDDEYQVLPTDWIRQCQMRWRPPEVGSPLTCLGVDVARGGKDNTVIAPLTWIPGTIAYSNPVFHELIIIPGKFTPTGEALADQIAPFTFPGAPIYIDVISWGAAAYEALKRRGHNVVPVNVTFASRGTDKTKRFRFANLRAELYWRFREAIDPESAFPLSLPPGHEIVSELASVQYKVLNGKIWIEEKDRIRARIGRSPDRGDAVVMAYHHFIFRSAITFWDGSLR